MRKRQVIRFEQNVCNANVNDNSVLFVRVRDAVRDKAAMFEVPPTHNAYLVLGGGDIRFYKSGAYPIFDTKEKMKNWKMGLSAEVIYIPKETSVVIRWGTSDKILYRDIPSNKVISVGARGQFGVTVANPEQFFRKVVGARQEFDLADFQTRFGAAVVSEFKDIFLKVVDEKHLTYDRFDANSKAIAVRVGEILTEKFTQSWGVGLVDFIIEGFLLSEGDKNAVENAAAEEQRQKQLRDYLAEAERLADKQWEREKFLRQLEMEDRSAYYEVLKVIGTAKPKEEKREEKEEKKPEPLKCPGCGMEFKPSDKFCPNCGMRVSRDPIICPKCKRKNEYNARFCSECGAKLTD